MHRKSWAGRATWAACCDPRLARSPPASLGRRWRGGSVRGRTRAGARRSCVRLHRYGAERTATFARGRTQQQWAAAVPSVAAERQQKGPWRRRGRPSHEQAHEFEPTTTGASWRGRAVHATHLSSACTIFISPASTARTLSFISGKVPAPSTDRSVSRSLVPTLAGAAKPTSRSSSRRQSSLTFQMHQRLADAVQRRGHAIHVLGADSTPFLDHVPAQLLDRAFQIPARQTRTDCAKAAPVHLTNRRRASDK